MKVSSIDEAFSRYGHIDFIAKRWTSEGYWMGICPVDFSQFPNWIVAGTNQKVRGIYCNRDMIQPLRSALHQISGNNLGHLLKTYDGCFNIRTARGSDRPSTHAFGLAIDINARDNQLGSLRGGFYDQPGIVKAFTDAGFSWGGGFKGRKDPMHFSYAGWESGY